MPDIYVYAILIILILIMILCLLLALVSDSSDRPSMSYEDYQIKLAGIEGEQKAFREICSILNRDDHLLTNIHLECFEKRAELDAVVVNECGVFIFEIKNWKGRIYGNIDEKEWIKVKQSYDDTFTKTEKNPIPQVKKEIYFLASYLKQNRIQLRVKGNVYFVNHNNPFPNEMLLNEVQEIDRVIHSCGKNKLDEQEISRICSLLKTADDSYEQPEYMN